MYTLQVTPSSMFGSHLNLPFIRTSFRCADDPGPDIVHSLQATMSSNLISGLVQFRSSLNLSPWVSGTVPVAPSLKAFPVAENAQNGSDGDDNCLNTSPPYVNSDELYISAQESQVGTIEETQFQLDARKSKEFRRASILDEEWQIQLERVCEEIRVKLAPGASSVTAQFYKLLLFAEGDFSNAHQDAQDSRRMFASLLFFLPVVYEGGAFKLFDDSWKEVVDQKQAGSSTSWVAFYTDVCHSMEKVKRGFRLVLKYQLLFEGSMCPSAALHTFDGGLERAFLRYMKHLKENGSMCGLAIPLKYKYTESTLFPDFLKGIDSLVYNSLTKIGNPELKHTLKIDKTKIFGRKEDGEWDWDFEFSGLYLVSDDIALKFRCIHQEHSSSKAREEAYTTALLPLLHDSCKGENELELLIPRYQGSWEMSLGNGGVDYSVDFRSKESYSWLGSMAPAAEYYYLDACMVLLSL
jgi:hypothetical protein